MQVRKKLCLVIPSLHAGGMERVMSELAVHFCYKPNLEVHLVMYGIKPEIFFSLPDNLIIHKPHFVFDNKKRVWHSIKSLLYLRRKIKQLNPSSILSFGEFWNSFVLLALLGSKVPIFVSDRCQPDKSLGKFHNTLRRILYQQSSKVIVQTKVAKEIYKQILPKVKITVIGNPIRTIKENPGALKENIVLSVGRLITSKHHDELIKLFVKINIPGWKLVIVGGDAIKQQNTLKLQTLVKELNAEDKVVLAGSRDDVDKFYLKSKIFAFTSSSEGFPNVIGEAMSAGLPVVAFDCIAGPSELIENEVTGYMVPLFDYSLFEERLKTLMMDETQCKVFGMNGKEKISDFSTDAICEQFYHTILSA